MSVKNPDCQMVQLHPLPYMGGARLQRGIANARAGRFNSSAARSSKEGGRTMKFARTCGGFAAVLSVGITLALACDHWAALLDKALMI